MPPSEACQAHKSSALHFIKASARLHLYVCLSLPMGLLGNASVHYCETRKIDWKQENRVPDCVGGCVGPEMRQVGGPSSSGQQRNMRLCSQLQEVHRSLLTLLPRMQPPAAAALMYA